MLKIILQETDSFVIRKGHSPFSYMYKDLDRDYLGELCDMWWSYKNERYVKTQSASKVYQAYLDVLDNKIWSHENRPTWRDRLWCIYARFARCVLFVINGLRLLTVRQFARSVRVIKRGNSYVTKLLAKDFQTDGD